MVHGIINVWIQSGSDEFVWYPDTLTVVIILVEAWTLRLFWIPFKLIIELFYTNQVLFAYLDLVGRMIYSACRIKAISECFQEDVYNSSKNVCKFCRIKSTHA